MFKKPVVILTSMFLAGGLIAAIGVGIAFAEYMSFEYDETTLAAHGERTTKDYSLTLADDQILEVRSRVSNCELVTDENIAQGNIEVIAEYNPVYVEPYFEANYNNVIAYADNYPNEHDGEHNNATTSQSSVVLYIGTNWLVDEGELFMQNKDLILNGLKNHVLIMPDYDTEASVIIKVNPADITRVTIM